MAEIRYWPGNVYSWSGSYAEREAIRKCSFTYDANLRLWVTTSVFSAWKALRSGATPIGDARSKLRQVSRSLYLSEALDIESCRCGNGDGFPSIVDPSHNLSRLGLAQHIPYQSVPLQYVAENGLNRVIIGDDPGLGKTIEAIMLLNFWRPKRILVVCPANKRQDWLNDLDRWWTDFLVADYEIVLKRAEPLNFKGPAVRIVSWGLLADTFESSDTDFDCIIADELHHAKDMGAKRTQILCRYAPFCKHFIGLSGTYPPNNAAELSPVLTSWFVNYIPLWPTRFEFNNHFANRTWDQYNQDYRFTGVRNEEELGFVLRSNFYIRRTIDDALPQLPKPEISILNIDVEEAVKREENEFLRVLRIDEFNELDLERLAKNIHYSAFRRRTCLQRLPFVVDYAKKVLSTENKLFIVAWHTDLISALEKELCNFGVVTITGNTSAEKKHRYKEWFQSDEKYRICLGQTQAVGEAIDLTAAAYGIIAEPSWSPKDIKQVIGRLRRYGQLRTPRFDFVVTRGSLDSRVLVRALTKQDDVASVLDRKERHVCMS